jgi:ribonuclease BN (tRNA processing enzyme)
MGILNTEMKCTFLGTRANIDASSAQHRFHSALKLSYYQTEVVIDCGQDWSEEVQNWDLDGIVITHAHPDHAFGLKNGAPCPVYATETAWKKLDEFPITEKHIMPVRQEVRIPEEGKLGLRFQAFPVLHSTKAPAVGYRISAGRVVIFYVPDVAWIEDRRAALVGIRVYIGDGSSVSQSLIRKPGETIIGHAPMQTQLTWCQKTGVSHAIFTHLGTEILKGDEAQILTTLGEMAEDRDVDEVELAHDRMTLILR